MEDKRADGEPLSADQSPDATPPRAEQDIKSASDLPPRRVADPLRNGAKFSPQPPEEITQTKAPAPWEAKLRVGREFGILLLCILAGTLVGLFLAIDSTEYFRAVQMQSALLQIFHAAGLPTEPGQTKTASIAPDTLRAATELLKQVREAQQEQRGFWTDIVQKILLNLLLPLLTAVFGYVFGRDQSDREDRAREKLEADHRGR